MEGAPEVLPSLPERLRTRAASILAGRGDGLVLGRTVVSADEGDVTLASRERLVGGTQVWAAGIVAPYASSEGLTEKARLPS